MANVSSVIRDYRFRDSFVVKSLRKIPRKQMKTYNKWFLTMLE